MRTRLTLVCATLLMAGALLSACGGSRPATTGTTSAITLYNGQHVQTTDALVSAFERSSGITVHVRSNDENTLDSQIVTEGARSPADVIFTENSPALEYLQDRGLLTAVDPSSLSRTPKRFSSNEGKWVGVSARVSVLVYNPARIAKAALPRHVLDLTKPAYKGMFAFAPGETDFQPIVTSVVHAYGKPAALSWLRGIKANMSTHAYPDNESIVAAVNRGTVAFGLINQYYWYRLRAQIGASHMHSALAFFAPRDPGYVIDVSGAAVLKSSTHREAAQAFLAFLTSKAGQEIIVHSDSFEYPIASGVTRSGIETPFSALRPNPIGVAALGDGSMAVGLLQEVQLL